MKLTVRNYHLDGYGHVNNARYLEFLEEARWTFFQEHDLLSELKDIMLVVARVDIRYRRPSLEGDVLTFTGRLKDIGTRHIILSQTATLPNGKAAIEAEVTRITRNSKPRIMKKMLTLLVVATIGALLTFVLIPSNKVAPDFALPDLQGKTITNADLKDKVTLINFWFPSCPGCVSEMPKIIKTAQDYQSKNFQVLGIAQPIDPIESVHQYVKEYGLPFTVMYDADKTAAKAFGTQVYPTSVLIAKNGKILKTYVGEPNFPQLYHEIDQALAQ